MNVAPAILCGLALGLGLWLLVSLAPRLSRPRLVARVAPYVIDVSAEARDLIDRRTADPLPVFGLLLEPVLGRLRAVVAVVAGGSTTTARRLRQSGSTLGVDAFRSRQLAWGAGGSALGIVGGIALVRIQSVTLAGQLALAVVLAVGGFVLRGYLLQRAANARVRRMSKQLPTILEFLTLSLSAGEGILDAIRRVSRVSSAELATELGTVIAAVSTGLPLVDSLNRLASDLQLVPLTRAVDQITGALERGTPLAEVLRAQAQDARDDAKRELIETSGKKEVTMLVPVKSQLGFLYPSRTIIGTRPMPSSRQPMDLPSRAPKALFGSDAFIAQPGVGEVVSRSPISIAPNDASTLQYVLPTIASLC